MTSKTVGLRGSRSTERTCKTPTGPCCPSPSPSSRITACIALQACDCTVNVLELRGRVFPMDFPWITAECILFILSTLKHNLEQLRQTVSWPGAIGDFRGLDSYYTTIQIHPMFLPSCLEDLILQFALYRVRGHYLRSLVRSGTGHLYKPVLRKLKYS